ncbi:dienelactone hydrolase-like enzyme [Nostoc sp. PCC 7524]|uniref:dienelactone hydrolase family protein n=1 Tax=Nostoc sp. (strain ATCC 29411 / PCC 7524) TaxID=28072 RepID=UPI00029F3CB7|nr:dienelactone hydrolase family protein [Nostoc sp. PCC 7524]AFY47587.1 dienelactone hydrolase-like enzyme [Nostoc sp. PCC 7524]
MNKTPLSNVEEQIVILELGPIHLKGELVIPTDAEGIVLFTHSGSSSRYSTCNHYLAHMLRQEGGLATLLIDLLTKEEEAIDQRTKHFGCDVDFLASRIVAITDWLLENPVTNNLNVGYFGADTGSGAALLAATTRPMAVKAIVSRSGQTDLVNTALACVQTPTLLVVGENDLPIIAMNEDAIAQISTQHKQLETISGATHQFGESGAIEEVGRLASQWFKHYLTSFEPRDLHLHTMSLN